MTGYGPLRPLLDESINDVMVNGPSNVYVDDRASWSRSRFVSATMITSHRWRRRLRRKVGRRIDRSSPMVDCRLPDGSRVNISSRRWRSITPASPSANSQAHRYDIAGMIENGTMTPAVGRLLEIAARSRLNVLVSGGTGSGKTTLLSALSQFIEHSERIVTIEDAAELQLQQPHGDQPGDPASQPRRHGAGDATRPGLNALRMRLTGSSSARCAAPRRSTCCRR